MISCNFAEILTAHVDQGPMSLLQFLKCAYTSITIDMSFVKIRALFVLF